jgi:Tol biopolymer transport system component
MKTGLYGLAVVCIVLLLAPIGDAGKGPSIDYMGQTRPGLEAKIFAKGIISTSARELNSVFSPNGDLFLFTRRDHTETYRIMETRYGQNGWSNPSVALFTEIHGAVDPAFSSDGRRVYFGSDRTGTLGDSDIWVVERGPDGTWGEVRNLGHPVNTPGNENHAAPTDDGTLYFHSAGHPGLGESDIFRTGVSADGFSTPVNLGPTINSEASEFDPYVSPDQSYLLFASTRQGGYGGGDLYISFHNEDGSWSSAVNLGDQVNTSATDYCPKVTPDGRFLFYTSRSTGEGDVYWIDAGILEGYRPHTP